MNYGAYKHTAQRLHERYGLNISPKEYDEMLVQVQSGDCECVGIQDDGRWIMTVKHGPQKIYFVYDAITKVIVTALTPHMAWSHMNRGGATSYKRAIQ